MCARSIDDFDDAPIDRANQVPFFMPITTTIDGSVVCNSETVCVCLCIQWDTTHHTTSSTQYNKRKEQKRQKERNEKRKRREKAEKKTHTNRKMIGMDNKDNHGRHCRHRRCTLLV